MNSLRYRLPLPEDIRLQRLLDRARQYQVEKVQELRKWLLIWTVPSSIVTSILKQVLSSQQMTLDIIRNIHMDDGGEAKHSRASSQQSIDDFRHYKKHLPQSKHGDEAKHLEASSQQSMDDFRHHKEHSPWSKHGDETKHSEASSQRSMDDFRHHKEHLPQLNHRGDSSQNFNEDFELLGFVEEDSGERLSDISDGGLSMGTETDASISCVVEFTLFPEVLRLTESTQARNKESQENTS